MITFPCTLYKIDPKNNIRVWSIEINYAIGFLKMTDGIDGGAMQVDKEYIYEGKQYRDLEEQLELRANSRVQDKLKTGYHFSIQDAKNNIGKDSSGLVRPMLAQVYKSKIIENEFAIQYKYDGNRCLIQKENDELFAYTRNGKPIKTIDHILTQVRDIPNGTILDGELYVHGMKLQDIRSLVSKKQKDSGMLDYVCYDTVSNEPFKNRYDKIRNISMGVPRKIGGRFRVADTTFSTYEKTIKTNNIFKILKEAISFGYEGLIIRQGSAGYEAGKRSKSLLKLKQFHDQEFTVIGIEMASDNTAILVFQVDKDLFFKAVAPGTHEEKLHIAKNQDDYLGKKVTVQYSMLTKDGIPFHPFAKSFRGI